MAEKRLKPGWRTWRFEQIAQIVNDRIDNPAEASLEYYVGLEHLDSDSLKIRRWGKPTDVEATKLRFRKGDIVFGRRRAYQRKLAVAEFDGICSAHAMVLRARPEVAWPEFLPFFMQSDVFMKRALEISAGSLSPTINWRTLAAQEFALPPLDEQRRLTGVLNQCLSTEESYRHLSERTDQARFSAVENLFAPEANGWQTRPIGELFDIVSGGTPSRGQRAFWGGDIPWVKTSEVNYSWIHSTEEFITKAGLDNSSAKLVPKNSVVMALFGQGPTLGRVARLGIEAATNQACAVFLPNTDQDQSFLFYFLWRQYRRIRAKARGASQPNLNLAIVKSLEFPAIPLENQKRLAEIADVLVAGSSHARGRFHAVRDLRARLARTALGQG